MSKPAKKPIYRIRNWAQYNRALVDWRSLTIWINEAAITAWAFAGPNQWGAQFKYSEHRRPVRAHPPCRLQRPAARHPGLGRLHLGPHGDEPGCPPL